MTQAELDAKWKQQIEDHVAQHGPMMLDGVNPPDAAIAAAGTMKADPMDFTQPDAPGGGEGAGDLKPKAMTFPGTDASGGFDALAPDPKTQTASNATKTAADTVQRPAVDYSGPLGWHPPARDTELEGLQQEAARRRGIASIGNAISEYQAQPNYAADNARAIAGGGSSAPARKSTLWDTYEAEGEQPLKDLEARRASAAKLRDEQTKTADDAEESDPHSTFSNAYRAAILKYAPELAPQLAETPGNLMRKIAPQLEQGAKLDAERMKNKQALDEKQAADKRDQARVDESNRHQTTAETETERHNRAEEAKQHAGKGPAAPATAEQQDAADVRAHAIANGQIDPPSLRAPDYKEVMAKVFKIRPDYDQSKKEAYAHTLKEQSTDNGIQSSKAVRHHMDLLRAIVDKMPDDSALDRPLLNRAKQAWAEGTGSDDYTALQTEAGAIGSELAQALGDKDKEGRANVQRYLRPDQTKKQWIASLDALEKLRTEKLGVASETLGALAPKPVDGTVKMVDPDGDTHDVPVAEVDAAMRKGLKKVTGG